MSERIDVLKEWPALGLLLLGLLNQDYKLDYSDAWSAVEAFAREYSDAPRAVAEIDEVLAAYPTEEQMDYFLFQIVHCAYSPVRDGWRLLDWMRAVQQRIVEIASQDAGPDM